MAPSSAALTANPRGLAGFGFLQDEWRAHPKLTLNVGLRYDIERISNVDGYDVPADKNNIQPRLSASWDPNGAGQTVIRGGVGLYTQQHLLYYINRVQLEGPDGAITLSLVPGAPLMPVFPDTLPPTLATVPPRDIQLVNARFRNPYSLQVAAGIERMLFGIPVRRRLPTFDGPRLDEPGGSAMPRNPFRSRPREMWPRRTPPGR